MKRTSALGTGVTMKRRVALAQPAQPALHTVKKALNDGRGGAHDSETERRSTRMIPHIRVRAFKGQPV